MKAFLLFAMFFAANAAADPLTIYTVNYPLQYFAQRIAGEHARVVFPAPADIDPAVWRPTPEQVIEYQRADLILLNGADYAGWVNKVTLPRFRMVNTSAGFEGDYIATAETRTHSHGPGGDHSHTTKAFTTWLDFNQAITQAEAIQQALAKADPERKAVFIQNFESLQQELKKLDRRMLAAAHRRAGAPVIFSHPVYQYMERRYRLNAKSLHWEPNDEVSEEQWRTLADLLNRHPAHWMVWEDTPSPATSKRLNEMGIEVIVFAPAANASKTDFMNTMRENVQAFERITEQ